MAPFRILTALVLSAGAVSGFAPANTLVNTREAITRYETNIMHFFSPFDLKTLVLFDIEVRFLKIPSYFVMKITRCGQVW